jgi:hypothetical protein
MALLAESLVEEWLNRQRFFTIRGVKHGVHEIDLLAVRREATGGVTGWHVEVQASFRPIGYICKLTNEMAGRSGRKQTSVRRRTEEEIRECATAWVNIKFNSASKRQVREDLWPGVVWTYHLVHAEVRDETELDFIREMSVTVTPFHKILYTLCSSHQNKFTGSAGGDLAEIVRYFGEWRSMEEYLR